MSNIAIPYWRLSGFYFFNCAVLGAILPYWGLYMQSGGYNTWQIGFIGSILLATNIAAPNVWGWLCDRFNQRRMRVIRMGTFVGCVSFAGVFFESGFGLMCLFIAGCSFCWQGLNSQFEMITLAHLQHQSHRYGRIRLWGSIGFIAAVFGLGWLFDQISLQWLPAITLLFLLCMWGVTLTIENKTTASANEPQGSFLQALKPQVVWATLLSMLILYISMGSYLTFFSLYLQQAGYDKTTTGSLWSLAVVAEILMFLLMPLLMTRYSIRSLLLVSLGLTGLRWLGIAAYPDSLPLLVILQSLHAFSFSVTHTVVMQVIRQFIPVNCQGRGQALYSSLCMGIGGALGAALAGWIWPLGPGLAFYMASGFAVLAILPVWKWVKS
ncbi:MFS transporter [Neptunicella sp. SCSIO 80796]|uniref:MFS transporter n=1 Tax=Neptunicella plasticusilytica TaxID=3117012 RepID=UPI003A4D4946